MGFFQLLHQPGPMWIVHLREDEKKPRLAGLLFNMLGGSGVSITFSMKLATPSYMYPPAYPLHLIPSESAH